MKFCPIGVCSYPYRLSSGDIVCAEVTKLDEEYFRILWSGDDGESRGADFYGPGAAERVHDYGKIVQEQFVRDLEGLNPSMPRYL